MRKRICIAFLGNAYQDSRVTNLKDSLEADNCDVSVISFDWSGSIVDKKDDKIKVIKIRGKDYSSYVFYLSFSFHLILELTKTKADIFFAEDLYTLPFVSTIAKLKRAKVYYNSRELYAFIGGLTKRPILQSIVRMIEKFFIKRVDLVMTTGEMDSQFIEDYYKIKDTLVIRNIPLYNQPTHVVDFRKMYSIPHDHKILLYQGVLQGGRGIPLMIKALSRIKQASLILLGDGEQKNNYIKLAKECGVEDQVHFVGTINQNELINYTAGGDIGVALIENISVSYYHALPNKLFEYIMAGLPVISSDLPQMKKIVEEYSVGIVAEIDDMNKLAAMIENIINNDELLMRYKENTKKAGLILNWQEEYKRVRNRLLPGR